MYKDTEITIEGVTVDVYQGVDNLWHADFINKSGELIHTKGRTRKYVIAAITDVIKKGVTDAGEVSR